MSENPDNLAPYLCSGLTSWFLSTLGPSLTEHPTLTHLLFWPLASAFGIPLDTTVLVPVLAQGGVDLTSVWG